MSLSRIALPCFVVSDTNNCGHWHVLAVVIAHRCTFAKRSRGDYSYWAYLAAVLVKKKNRHYSGSVPGMKRKAKAMGATQSSDSASRRSVISDAVPSTSLSQEDVRVAFLHDLGWVQQVEVINHCGVQLVVESLILTPRSRKRFRHTDGARCFIFGNQPLNWNVLARKVWLFGCNFI